MIWGSLIAGVASIVVGGLALWSARTTSRNQTAVASNQTQLDAFDRLTERHEHEIARLDLALDEERAVSKALATQNERLQEENRMLREQVEQ